MVTALLDFSRELGDLILQSCFLEAIKRKKNSSLKLAFCNLTSVSLALRNFKVG